MLSHLMEENKKERLLRILQHHTFITLRPSTIHGIGVFAVAEIPKGTRGFFSDDKSEWISLQKNEVEQLPAQSRALIENHCLYDEENYFVPEYGFRLIDPVVFLNHSDQPNIQSIQDGEDFEALRDIRAGEELFVNYGEIVNSQE